MRLSKKGKLIPQPHFWNLEEQSFNISYYHFHPQSESDMSNWHFSSQAGIMISMHNRNACPSANEHLIES